MKKTILSIVSIALVCVTLLALVACGSSGVEGTYSDESGASKIKLKGGEWTQTLLDNELLSGTYEVDGNKITLKYNILGEETTYATGTVEGGKLTINGVTFSK
ncbi:MAG: hypothetical protein J1E00_07470 [Oscillospiraceae bacterium]|nr:hypothetical protein [Oscillospiraceae bacterium]